MLPGDSTVREWDVLPTGKGVYPEQHLLPPRRNMRVWWGCVLPTGKCVYRRWRSQRMLRRCWHLRWRSMRVASSQTVYYVIP